MLNREPYIDIVIGPQSYHKINDKLRNFIKGSKIEETEFDTVSKFNYFDNINNKSNKISSYLTIQEGCDKFCSFCVVPYTRGPEYSRPFNKIISEAESLIKNGTREIILLGQNVNAYSFKEKTKEFLKIGWPMFLKNKGDVPWHTDDKRKSSITFQLNDSETPTMFRNEVGELELLHHNLGAYLQNNEQEHSVPKADKDRYFLQISFDKPYIEIKEMLKHDFKSTQKVCKSGDPNYAVG